MAVPIIEICVDTLEGAQAAARGGADRIEFCSALSESGLTPSSGLVDLALELVPIPVHVMVRPRSGDFVYSRAEFVSMERDIERFKAVGVHGIVLGVLTRDNEVDVERTRQLVKCASPMPVTFHRAFDECRDLEQALEDVIASGAKMLLTSGGASSLAHGASTVARLVQLAGDRIEIIASAGVTIETAPGLWRSTQSAAIHASLRRPVSGSQLDDRRSAVTVISGIFAGARFGPLEEDVRALVGSFRTPSAESSIKQ